MKTSLKQLLWICLCLAVVSTSVAGAAEEADDKAQKIFNGENLKGWDGNLELWSVEDHAIVGRTSAEKPIASNTFLVWQGGDVTDFRLTLEYKIEGGNSGIQYRSKIINKENWGVGGYQADIDSGPNFTGITFEEGGRGILALRGQKAVITKDGKKIDENFGDAAELQKSIKTDGWNKYEIEAIGPVHKHTINGKLMSGIEDNQTAKRASKGILAFQLHVGGPMTVRFRNIKLEKIEPKKEGVVTK